ncbi:hypothetical protein ACH0B5_17030 [Ureibacillus sp. 179-F W5.1 NHS]|uniref:hypothetical protein n=1 Tax=Ureibacillus sp. 179-F W5.1 NHS TaxID=3374297 RepID=UPI0038790E4D
MKKILFGLLLLLTLALAACGSTSENVSGKVDTDKANSTEQEAGEKASEEASNDENEINQLIVDNENVKATLVKIVKKSDDIWGNTIEVVFDVENKRSDTIEVQANTVSADGRMVDETLLSMSQEVAPGKAATATLTINEFEGYDFPALESDFEMTLHIFSWDDYDYTEDLPVKVTF